MMNRIDEEFRILSTWECPETRRANYEENAARTSMIGVTARILHNWPDAFLTFPCGKKRNALGLCDFIMPTARDRSEALRLVIPPAHRAARCQERIEKREPRRSSRHPAAHHRLSLENVSNEISATDIRRRAHRRPGIHGLVSARVEEYILKQAYIGETRNLPQVSASLEGQRKKAAGIFTVLDLSGRFRFSRNSSSFAPLQHSTGAGICTEVEEQLYKHLGRRLNTARASAPPNGPCSTSAASSCTFSASRPPLL